MTENNHRKPNYRLIILAMFVGLISAAGGISFWRVMQGPHPTSNATLMVLPEPKVIADFALIDGQGQAFSLENLRGKWSLLFFGFTHCPDVCPSALYDLNLISESLKNQGGDAAEHQVVFISVDPERDTPEKLSQYVAYFNPDFIGVTGNQEQLKPLTMQLGIAYQFEEHEPGAERYDVYHTASVMLINPRGQLHGVFPAPHNAEKMAGELADVID
jgi:protein SCO1/2